MKLKQEARGLKSKSVSSMRSAMTAFNSPRDDGRVTAVLLHLQHAFEMLLKAALVQGSVSAFDKKTGRSVSFEHAVRQANNCPDSSSATRTPGRCARSMRCATTRSTD